MQTSVYSRAVYLLITTLASSSLLLCSGCGRSKAAAARTPPPQMLSEPVPEAPPPAIAAPVVPEAPASASTDAYVAQLRGQSRELPVFRDPTMNRAPQEPIAVSVPLPAITETPGGARYHTLQKGETIFAVSRKYNVKPKQILDANNFKDPSKLAVGTKVLIP